MAYWYSYESQSIGRVHIYSNHLFYFKYVNCDMSTTNCNGLWPQIYPSVSSRLFWPQVAAIYGGLWPQKSIYDFKNMFTYYMDSPILKLGAAHVLAWLLRHTYLWIYYWEYIFVFWTGILIPASDILISNAAPNGHRDVTPCKFYNKKKRCSSVLRITDVRA